MRRTSWRGIPLDQAKGTFLVYAEQDLGCHPGMVPTGVLTLSIRLCRDCARKTGAEVGELTSGEIPGVRQRDARDPGDG